MPQGIQLTLTPEGDALQHLAANLSAKQLDKAKVRAINSAIRKENTQYRREIVKHYNIKYADTKEMVVAQKATAGQPEGRINGNTKPISISRFNPSFVHGGQVLSIAMLKNKATGKRELTRKSKNAGKRDSAGGGVSFEIQKGKKQNLPFAFFTQSETNLGVEKQVFARGKYSGNQLSIGKTRYPIAALKTVSPFGTMTKSEISKEIEKGASAEMSKEFRRQIQLLLKK